MKESWRPTQKLLPQKIVLTYTDICIVRTVNIIKPIPIHHLHACVEKL